MPDDGGIKRSVPHPPHGFTRYCDYIEKLIDNFYQFSKIQYTKRIRLRVISKINKRKKLHKKLIKLMPAYANQLKGWEKKVMKDHNINMKLIN